jgi:RNA polymerase sigma-70 factor (ECF subfamily)
VEADVVVVNGAPALRLLIDGEVDGIGTMLVEDGMVTGLYIVRNPAKLSRLDDVVALTR